MKLNIKSNSNEEKVDVWLAYQENDVVIYSQKPGEYSLIEGRLHSNGKFTKTGNGNFTLVDSYL